MSGESRSASPGASFARYSLEGIVAVFFLLFALETFSHRHFSPEPRYRVAISAFAALSGTLGLLPLLHHISPRFGRISFFVWLSAVAALLLVGWATKP